MKTNLRLASALAALLILTVTHVSAQEVRQALAETFDAVRQSTWLYDADGSFNPTPAEDTWCGDESCGCCNQCCRPLNMWGQVEFLMWWGRGSDMPPLVTTSNPSTVPQAQAGVLGFGTTEILLGDETFGDEIQAGARLNLGIWLDNLHNVGLGVRCYGLEGDTDNFFEASTGDPILARPYFSELLQQEDAERIAYTDPILGPIVDGSVGVIYNSSFVGTDVYTRIMMERCRINRVDIIGGYTYMRLADNLAIRSFSTFRQPIIAGTTFQVYDHFSTSNVFHGGMLGLMGTRARDRWSIDWLAKASLGTAKQRVRIAGNSIVTPLNGAPNLQPGGLLALPSNIGEYTNSQTVVIPELTVNLNYHLSTNWSVGIGYNLIWMSSAITSGPQIDRQLDLSQRTGLPAGPLPTRPLLAQFNNDDYWLMGINMSLRAEY